MEAIDALLQDSGAALTVDSQDDVLRAARHPGAPAYAVVQAHGHRLALLCDSGRCAPTLQNGRTPLSYAAERGHMATVTKLLEKDATVDLKSEVR